MKTMMMMMMTLTKRPHASMVLKVCGISKAMTMILSEERACLNGFERGRSQLIAMYNVQQQLALDLQAAPPKNAMFSLNVNPTSIERCVTIIHEINAFRSHFCACAIHYYYVLCHVNDLALGALQAPGRKNLHCVKHVGRRACAALASKEYLAGVIAAPISSLQCSVRCVHSSAVSLDNKLVSLHNSCRARIFSKRHTCK